MSAPRHPSLVCLPVLLLALGGTTGCTGDDQDSTPPWTEPGLVDRDGRPTALPDPPRSSGAQLDATTLGADPAPGTGDDAPAIRRALARAVPGDQVYLPPGTYDLETPDPDDSSTHLTLADGVSLRGAGIGMTLLRSDFDGDDDSAVLRGSAVQDVVVTGLTVTSTYDGPLGTDTEDDDAGGGPMFGIYVGEQDGRGSARVLIEDVRVERFQRHGISIKASHQVTVRDNEVADATSVGAGGSGYGIAIEGRADQRDPEAPNDSRHNQVIGNVLDGTHLRHAILLQFPTHNNLVADNVVHGSLLDAIDLHGEGEYLNEIRDNIVTDGDRAGIALGNSGGDTHEHGASGEGNWVHHNLLVGNRDGILVILGTPDTLIEQNRIVAGSDSETGIHLDHAPGTTVRDNTIDSAGEDAFVPLRDPRD